MNENEVRIHLALVDMVSWCQFGFWVYMFFLITYAFIIKLFDIF